MSGVKPSISYYWRYLWIICMEMWSCHRSPLDHNNWSLNWQLCKTTIVSNMQTGHWEIKLFREDNVLSGLLKICLIWSVLNKSITVWFGLYSSKNSVYAKKSFNGKMCWFFFKKKTPLCHSVIIALGIWKKMYFI